MRHFVCLAVLCCILNGYAGAPEADPALFEARFEGPDSLAQWQGQAGTLEKGWQATSSLLIAAGSSGHAVRTKALPAEKMAGRLITLRAVVKSEGISKPPASWNGIKVMLVLERGEARDYPQLRIPAAAFDWRSFSRTIRVPAGLTGATLLVGLEKVSGKVWFDDVSVRMGRPGPRAKPFPARFKIRGLPRLRGVMHGPRFSEKDIRDLAVDWGANQVRWQLNWTPMKQAEVWARDLEAFDRWLDGALAECDKALDACEKYGLHVLVDLHTPPGGRVDGGVCPLFSRKECQEKFLAVWTRIAARYKGRKAVYAYDLLNEAVEGAVAPGLLNWRDLATEAARAIRRVDPGRPVVFEPSPWGGPDGFDSLNPLPVAGVIYSFHMYKPHAFTHQTLYNNPGGLRYPGVVNGALWNKEALREAMMPAIDFQKAFNVPIYVGEFSAIRWAPDQSAFRYLRDVIDLFEEYQWDWSYHAYREWDGWSVEHGPVRENRRPAEALTARGRLLRSWFMKSGRLPDKK